MVRSLLSLWTVLPSVVLAVSLDKRWDDVKVKHAWTDIPRGWAVHAENAPPEHILDLQIGLKQGKFDELVDELYRVSDPNHPSYGAHLSKEAVRELVAPHKKTEDAIEAWLIYHGVDLSSVHRSPAGDYVYLSVTVAQAERMLSAKYRLFHNPSSGAYVVRTTAYSLPSVLHPHVSVIAPTTYFGQESPMKPLETLGRVSVSGKSLAGRAEVPSNCTMSITPSCLRALYNTSNYTPQAPGKNKIGITGYVDEFANDADLQAFFERFLSEAVGTTVEHVQVNGGKNDQTQPGREANLNVQYVMGMTFPTPAIYYSTGGSPPYIPDSETPTNTNEPYLDWLNYVLALDDADLPQTFSTSYGDNEQTVPEDYAQSVCSMFAQLGARGASVIFSSGDDGVGRGDCQNNDGTNTTSFQPHFPASCPFVTSVGATYGINPEKGAYFSGGGFSEYFERPSYQSAAVSAYLDTVGSQYAGLFNATGRAYPDVSAQGANYQTIVNGETTTAHGTSAAAPVVAGIVSLLNDFRIASGKPPLGFLNPMLYSKGIAGLNDITSGKNPGCGTDGFNASAGWDPLFGLGTPDFEKLRSIITDL